MPRSFKLTVAYDGTQYSGWQVQPGQPTIQQTLQQAVLATTGEAADVIGSGRTDAGVHAVGQVAACRLQRWRATANDLMRALNSQLPETIVIRGVEDASEDFHPIRDAIGKRYRYELQVGGLRDAFEHRYRWHIRADLDFGCLRQAASRLVGRHDFASFEASGATPKKSTIRDLRACDVILQGPREDGGTRLAIEVEADGFLYNMVRNIVGTLVEVGRGRRDPAWITTVLDAHDRRVAGPTAPPQGLFLVRVDYR